MRRRPGTPSAVPVTRTSSVSVVGVDDRERVVEAIHHPGARRPPVEHLDVERIVADRDALDARLRPRRDRRTGRVPVLKTHSSSRCCGVT